MYNVGVGRDTREKHITRVYVGGDNRKKIIIHFSL
jgi:hypothetical protein